MTSHVTIPRTDDMSKPGPHWFLPDLWMSPLITCPSNHRALANDHEIAADGTVSPSLQCPQCEWHVMGRLEGWAEKLTSTP